jgi:hypothetical protein
MARHRCHELTQEALLECEGMMSLQVQLEFVGLSLKQPDKVKSCHKTLAVPVLVNDYLPDLHTNTKCRLHRTHRCTTACCLTGAWVHPQTQTKACEQHQQHCVESLE